MAQQRPKEVFFRSKGRRSRDEALSALAGADHHLSIIRNLEESGLSDQQQVNVLHYSIRGFFWELYSVVDSIDHVEDPPAFVTEWAKDIRGSQWFLEISAYRNLAHRMFHLAEVVRGPTGNTVMIQQGLASQAGMLGSDQMVAYWREMDEALRELLTRDEPAGPA